MHHAAPILLAAFVLVHGLVARRLEGTPLTAPILAVVYGMAIGPLGFDALGLDVRDETLRVLAELTLALVLFHDAARIDLRRLRSDLRTPERLLGPGLLLTIGLATVAAKLVFPDFTWFEAALVGAMVAPTDAALGQAVVSNESVPPRIRRALNVESGLNDGLVVPVFAVTLMCASGEASAAGGSEDGWIWVEHAVTAIGYGVGAGLVLGLVLVTGIGHAIRRGWTGGGARNLAVAAVPLLAFFGAETVHGSGFLAAFVCGLVFGSRADGVDREAYEFTEDAGTTFGHLTWIGFGAAAAPVALECATVSTVAFALLALTVIRMVPVALSLIGSGDRADTVLFIGWFGPRGLATVVFAAVVHGTEGLASADALFGIAVWTVLLSVLLHGVTAGPLAAAYGRRHAAEGEASMSDVPAAKRPMA